MAKMCFDVDSRVPLSSAILEHHAAKFYKAIIERIKEPDARLLLVDIYLERIMRKEIMKTLAGTKRLPRDLPTDAEPYIAKVVFESVEFLKSMTKRVKEGDGVKMLLSSMLVYESSVGKEYASLVLAKGFGLATGDEVAKMIFDDMSVEEAHVKYIKKALEIIKST